MYTYIKVFGGIDADDKDSVEYKIVTGQRTAKEGFSYYWNPAVYKNPKFVTTQPRKCKKNVKI